ncbi:MAG: 50S ribosome-binding GTPase [Nanoarchaeota archaeon]|nr:50S ribosome-binding GTPase [Nanoarchaeota archaeon]MBU4086022.1 50S ribosome-binding GTPase [Nanoarchaeota archaeon]
MRVRYSFSSRRTRRIEGNNSHRNAFPKVVKEMIDKCEIILEILDARFLKETRNTELETLIKQADKSIIYVINKSDLVDRDKLKETIESLGIFPFVLVSCKDRRGLSNLREKIKIESKKYAGKFPKTHIGVVGYPNTGKSSVINILIGRASARTAPEAGFTKGIQKLKLTSDLYILDTPGVIPEAKYSMQDSVKMSEHTKISARNWEKVSQPDFIVHRIMQEFPGILEEFYNIPAGGNSELLIEELGKKKKFLLSKNRIDIDRTARLIIKEWQEGKINSETS